MRRNRKNKKKLVWDPTLEKEEDFQFKTSQRMNGKTGVPGGNPLVECGANPVILFFMRVSLPSKLSKAQRERDAHIHSLTILHAYIRTNAVLW